MNDFWTFVKLNREMVASEILETVFGVCKVLFAIALVFLCAFMIVSLPLIWSLISMTALFFGFAIALRISSVYNNYKIYTKENSSIPRNTLK